MYIAPPEVPDDLCMADLASGFCQWRNGNGVIFVWQMNEVGFARS